MNPNANQEVDPFNVPVSNVKGGDYTKPHIEKGYYAGKLVDIKQILDDKGVEKIVTGKNGNSKRWVMLYAVHEIEKRDGKKVVGKPVTVKKDNVETDVIVSQLVYYANQTEKGEWRTNFTPNSGITKVFKALGWAGPAAAGENQTVNVKSFIGRWCELNINDYEVKADGDSPAYTASGIVKDGVNPLKDTELPSGEVTAKGAEDLTQEQFDAKQAGLQALVLAGQLTKEGYDRAIEQLKSRLAH